MEMADIDSEGEGMDKYILQDMGMLPQEVLKNLGQEGWVEDTRGERKR